MEKIYIKIENYLKDNFPKKTIIKSSTVVFNDYEIYGFKGIPIMVLETENEIHYQLLKII